MYLSRCRENKNQQTKVRILNFSSKNIIVQNANRLSNVSNKFAPTELKSPPKRKMNTVDENGLIVFVPEESPAVLADDKPMLRE